MEEVIAVVAAEEEEEANEEEAALAGASGDAPAMRRAPRRDANGDEIEDDEAEAAAAAAAVALPSPPEEGVSGRGVVPLLAAAAAAAPVASKVDDAAAAAPFGPATIHSGSCTLLVAVAMAAAAAVGGTVKGSAVSMSPISRISGGRDAASSTAADDAIKDRMGGVEVGEEDKEFDRGEGALLVVAWGSWARRSLRQAANSLKKSRRTSVVLGSTVSCTRDENI